MGARRHSDGGSGCATAIVFVLVLGVIVKYFWWIAGAAALAGAFFAVRAIVRKVEQRRLEAAERNAELARRAEEQHRWTLRGDSRGVYGPAGAKAMRSVVPTPLEMNAADERPGSIQAAAVAYTAGELAKLVEDKPPCWRWAAFASVLVQRRARLQARLRDSALGFAVPTNARLHTAAEVKYFVAERMDELSELLTQLESFMRAPAFAGMFGNPDDEDTADADGILHIANRLMDYLERLLQLSEVCRGVSAPSQYSDLMRDCARLTDVPLEGYRTFIDEFVVRVGEMAELLPYAKGTVAVDPVVLQIDLDDDLVARFMKRLKELPAY